MEKSIITISREYGSGGRLVGKNTFKNIRYSFFYDNELITLSAQKTGLSQHYFKEAESASVGNILFLCPIFCLIIPLHEVYGLPLTEKNISGTVTSHS